MSRTTECDHSSGTVRWRIALWKRVMLAVMAVSLVSGLTGCALDDLVMPIGGDIPFEQEQTTPPEMGAVDNNPRIPAEDVAVDRDQYDFR